MTSTIDWEQIVRDLDPEAADQIAELALRIEHGRKCAECEELMPKEDGHTHGGEWTCVVCTQNRRKNAMGLVQNAAAAMRTIEGQLRSASTMLWMETVDDPETATVESEAAGMTPERKAIAELLEEVDAAAERIEAIVNRPHPFI